MCTHDLPTIARRPGMYIHTFLYTLFISISLLLGRPKGIEPSSPGPQPGALPLSYGRHIEPLVPPARFERTSHGLEVRCSIH